MTSLLRVVAAELRRTLVRAGRPDRRLRGAHSLYAWSRAAFQLPVPVKSSETAPRGHVREVASALSAQGIAWRTKKETTVVVLAHGLRLLGWSADGRGT